MFGDEVDARLQGVEPAVEVREVDEAVGDRLGLAEADVVLDSASVATTLAALKA